MKDFEEFYSSLTPQDYLDIRIEATKNLSKGIEKRMLGDDIEEMAWTYEMTSLRIAAELLRRYHAWLNA